MTMSSEWAIPLSITIIQYIYKKMKKVSKLLIIKFYKCARHFLYISDML